MYPISTFIHAFYSIFEAFPRVPPINSVIVTLKVYRKLEEKNSKYLPDVVVDDDVVAVSILLSIFLLRFDCLPDTQLIDVPELDALAFFDFHSFMFAINMFLCLSGTMNRDH